MTLSIRPVDREALIETVRIYLACMRADYTFLPQAYLDALTVEDELAECEAWVFGGEGTVRVIGAFDGAEMVGYAAVGPNTGEPAGYEGEVNNLFVRPGQRGKGIGLRLLQAGLVYLQGLGYEKVIIYNYQASESNGFYRHLGGEVVYRTVQRLGGMALDVDVFAWEVARLLETIGGKMKQFLSSPKSEME